MENLERFKAIDEVRSRLVNMVVTACPCGHAKDKYVNVVVTLVNLRQALLDWRAAELDAKAEKQLNKERSDEADAT